MAPMEDSIQSSASIQKTTVSDMYCRGFISSKGDNLGASPQYTFIHHGYQVGPLYRAGTDNTCAPERQCNGYYFDWRE
jgi:hypothetical protein